MGDILYNFGQGFKRARKKCGYKTQQSFVDAFRYDGDKSVCLETVRNWEQNRNIPEIKMIMALCDFFKCDMDYLFFRIDCANHNMQFIHEQTGLSETAIEKLNNMKILNDTLREEQDLQTVNKLLEQLGENNSIVGFITAYLTSNGLAQDMYIDMMSGVYSNKNNIITTGKKFHISAHAEIFDNLLIMEIQKQLTKLKNKDKI